MLSQAKVKVRIAKPIKENIDEAKTILESAGIVAIPTETVYGLSGNAFDEKALLKIFETKKRPHFDPLIIHVNASRNSLDELSKFELVDLEKLSNKAKKVTQKLIEEFWPGPLTLILPKQNKVPDLATSGLDTVAIRMPRHPVFQELLSRLSFPLAAPSANRFGRISPTTAYAVEEEFKDGEGNQELLILDGGECEIGVESTVVLVDPESGDLTLLRPGGVSTQELKAVGPISFHLPHLSSHLPSPGLLKSHYAPLKPLALFSVGITETPEDSIIQTLGKSGKIALLLASKHDLKHKRQTFEKLGFSITKVICLTEVLSNKNLPAEQAAKKLFSALRELDQSEAGFLIAEIFPDNEGLGFAINDRLRRASGVCL